MAESYCCHDHIVLLVDKEDFENPPSWIKNNFHVIEGGEHAGKKSDQLSPCITLMNPRKRGLEPE
jgi:hypothetical protein